MTDRARFELLATSVLRKADRKYVAVIHTGVNAQGETIAVPFDGLGLVPDSDPPHYVFVQHTTTDRSRLRQKWLIDKDADLPKGVNEASRVREYQPEAQFTVVLCTNQRVDPDLFLAVEREAQAHRVGIDIWEQSRIAGFLDTRPDGHWLRKVYLGIEAERLSDGLLRTLCRISAERYRRVVLGGEQNPLVRRRVEEDIRRTVASGETSLCLLVGVSGFGKSVACLQAMEIALGTATPGIWLPTVKLRDIVSIEAALDAWLRELHPSLEAGSGRNALDLWGKMGRVMVAVDDINRTSDPASLLRTLLAAASPSSRPAAGDVSAAQTGEGSTLPPFVLVVPVWPDHLQYFTQKDLEKRWIHMVSVGEMTNEESRGLIRSVSPQLSEVEASDFADRLGGDPFLVGHFTSMLRQQSTREEMVAIAEDVIGQFIKQQVKILTRKCPGRLLAADFHEVLESLAREMLLRRSLQPSRTDLQGWFGDTSREIAGLRALVQHEHLCRLDSDRLVFRHDRIRDRLLVDAMDVLLRLDEPPEDVIFDPYFAPIVGQALSRAGHRDDWPARFRPADPLPLFEAIRHFGEPAEDHHHEIVAQAQAWAAKDSRSAPSSLIDAVSWTLRETESSSVVPLVDAMKPNLWLMLAGLRNGSVTHGLRYIKPHVSIFFEPGMEDRMRDRVLAHAAHRYRGRLTEKLREPAESKEMAWEDAAAFLALIGHLSLGGFDDLIASLWTIQPSELVAYGIWAAARCPVERVDCLLGPMFDYMESICKKQNRRRGNWRSSWSSWRFHRGITEQAVSFLLKVARNREPLVDYILCMLGGIDRPDVLEYVVRHQASGRCSLSDAEPEFHPLSTQSTDRLKQLWESASESREVQREAFSVWLSGTGCRDSELLRHVKRDSPFSLDALQHRVKLGDLSAVDELVLKLQSRSAGGHWWKLAHRVWCDKLRAFADKALADLRESIPTDFSGGRSNAEHLLADLLAMIPPPDAESLLEAHWDHLMYSRPMVVAALRIATPKCVEMARISMAACRDIAGTFEGAFLGWQRANQCNPLTIRHFENLVPYLDRLTEADIGYLALMAERITDPVRWRQFDGQSECLRLMGKGTFSGGSKYRCLFSVVPVGIGASPAVNPGDFVGQGAA